MSRFGEAWTEGELQGVALLFRLMGDPTRLRILSALSGSNLCVRHISERVGTSQSATSHQLALLRRADLVRVARSGKSVVYSLADDHVRQMLELALVHEREEGRHE